MAGTSKSYRRLSNPPVPIEKTSVNSFGQLETYLEWDVYQAKYTPGQHVMDSDGRCTGNPGMDAAYYAHGPEHGDGGAQTHIVNTPVPPTNNTNDTFPASLPMTLS
jgi:hypothetical protein